MMKCSGQFLYPGRTGVCRVRSRSISPERRDARRDRHILFGETSTARTADLLRTEFLGWTYLS
jgi:hypothetical protein